MAKPIIKTKKLEVTYNLGKSNEFKALNGVDVEIFSGEYIILFGPSGCGKSTLLYCILGSLPPSGGSIIVKGDPIYAYSSKEMVNYQRYVIGIMYQAFNLIPSLSVQDNVSLPQIFAEVNKRVRDARAMELLTRFGVNTVAHKIPATLSGGQQQRVAVSRSLVNDPEILLGDEPVGNLDSISAEQVMNKLDEINSRDGKTVILVTHDAKYLPYAHRIYYLRDGIIEREVVNPEKKQIKKVEPGTTIVTEIEQLARMYPYDSIEELRVKSILNYLTQDLNLDQLKTVGRGAEEMIKGTMSEEKFFELLHAKYADGGVGMRSAEAREMAEKIKKIVKEARDIGRYRKTMNMDLAFFYQHKFVKRLKKYLLREYNKKLSAEQQRRLETAIADRVSGITKRRYFQKQLDLSLSKGGVGLNRKTAHDLTEYLEKLMAQGVSYIIAKH